MESAQAGKGIELVQLGRGVPCASQELPDHWATIIPTVSPQPPHPPQPTISGFKKWSNI